MKKLREIQGITLVALVVTIIILLILVGVAIGTLGGENGLIAKVRQAKKAQIKAEMKERLSLAISELQVEKEGKATLDDVTQEWINGVITDYDCIITSDASMAGKKVTMQKSEITGKYIIDQNLNITETEDNNSSVEFSYEVGTREGDIVKILIRVQDKENGLSRIELPDQDPIIVKSNKKEEVGIDYDIEIGKEYKLKIISENGQETEEKILITDYWHTITKNLGEGISIDNIAVKATYNKPYEATLTSEEAYVINAITVKMAGTDVTSTVYDSATGKINIEKVTGDIEITATTKKITKHIWNLGIQNSDFETYKGTPIYKGSEEGLYLANNSVLSTKSNIDLNENYTILLEVKNIKIEEVANHHGFLLSMGYGGSEIGSHLLGITCIKTETQIFAFSGAGDEYSLRYNSFSSSDWKLLAIKYDGTEFSFFIDGVKIGSSGKSNNIGGKLYIGGTSNSGTYGAGCYWGYGEGYYRNLAIYNIALSDEEIINYKF